MKRLRSALLAFACLASGAAAAEIPSDSAPAHLDALAFSDGLLQTDEGDGTAPPVRTAGAEVGLRGAWTPRLRGSLALRLLDSESQLPFVGDMGLPEPGRPSRRYGIELASSYAATEWLALDARFAFANARYLDASPDGRHVPGAASAAVGAGVTCHGLAGFSGEVRLRYLGPRALVASDELRFDSATLLSGQVSYDFDERWSLTLEAFSTLGRQDRDLYRLHAAELRSDTADPVDDAWDAIHFQPQAPAALRLELSARF